MDRWYDATFEQFQITEDGTILWCGKVFLAAPTPPPEPPNGLTPPPERNHMIHHG